MGSSFQRNRLLRDRQGRIWLLAEDGLYRSQEGNVKYFGEYWTQDTFNDFNKEIHQSAHGLIFRLTPEENPDSIDILSAFDFPDEFNLDLSKKARDCAYFLSDGDEYDDLLTDYCDFRDLIIGFESDRTPPYCKFSTEIPGYIDRRGKAFFKLEQSLLDDFYSWLQANNRQSGYIMARFRALECDYETTCLGDWQAVVDEFCAKGNNEEDEFEGYVNNIAEAYRNLTWKSKDNADGDISGSGTIDEHGFFNFQAGTKPGLNKDVYISYEYCKLIEGDTCPEFGGWSWCVDGVFPKENGYYNVFYEPAHSGDPPDYANPLIWFPCDPNLDPEIYGGAAWNTAWRTVAFGDGTNTEFDGTTSDLGLDFAGLEWRTKDEAHSGTGSIQRLSGDSYNYGYFQFDTSSYIPLLDEELQVRYWRVYTDNDQKEFTNWARFSPGPSVLNYWDRVWPYNFKNAFWWFYNEKEDRYTIGDAIIDKRGMFYLDLVDGHYEDSTSAFVPGTGTLLIDYKSDYAGIYGGPNNNSDEYSEHIFLAFQYCNKQYRTWDWMTNSYELHFLGREQVNPSGNSYFRKFHGFAEETGENGILQDIDREGSFSLPAITKDPKTGTTVIAAAPNTLGGFVPNSSRCGSDQINDSEVVALFDGSIEYTGYLSNTSLYEYYITRTYVIEPDLTEHTITSESLLYEGGYFVVGIPNSILYTLPYGSQIKIDYVACPHDPYSGARDRQIENLIAAYGNGYKDSFEDSLSGFQNVSDLTWSFYSDSTNYNGNGLISLNLLGDVKYRIETPIAVPAGEPLVISFNTAEQNFDIWCRHWRETSWDLLTFSDGVTRTYTGVLNEFGIICDYIQIKFIDSLGIERKYSFVPDVYPGSKYRYDITLPYAPSIGAPIYFKHRYCTERIPYIKQNIKVSNEARGLLGKETFFSLDESYLNHPLDIRGGVSSGTGLRFIDSGLADEDLWTTDSSGRKILISGLYNFSKDFNTFFTKDFFVDYDFDQTIKWDKDDNCEWTVYENLFWGDLADVSGYYQNQAKPKHDAVKFANPHFIFEDPAFTDTFSSYEGYGQFTNPVTGIFKFNMYDFIPEEHRDELSGVPVSQYGGLTAYYEYCRSCLQYGIVRELFGPVPDTTSPDDPTRQNVYWVEGYLNKAPMYGFDIATVALFYRATEDTTGYYQFDWDVYSELTDSTHEATCGGSIYYTYDPFTGYYKLPIYICENDKSFGPEAGSFVELYYLYCKDEAEDKVCDDGWTSITGEKIAEGDDYGVFFNGLAQVEGFVYKDLTWQSWDSSNNLISGNGHISEYGQFHFVVDQLPPGAGKDVLIDYQVCALASDDTTCSNGWQKVIEHIGTADGVGTHFEGDVYQASLPNIDFKHLWWFGYDKFTGIYYYGNGQIDAAGHYSFDTTNTLPDGLQLHVEYRHCIDFTCSGTIRRVAMHEIPEADKTNSDLWPYFVEGQLSDPYCSEYLAAWLYTVGNTELIEISPDGKYRNELEFKNPTHLHYACCHIDWDVQTCGTDWESIINEYFGHTEEGVYEFTGQVQEECSAYRNLEWHWIDYYGIKQSGVGQFLDTDGNFEINLGYPWPDSAGDEYAPIYISYDCCERVEEDKTCDDNWLYALELAGISDGVAETLAGNAVFEAQAYRNARWYAWSKGQYIDRTTYISLVDKSYILDLGHFPPEDDVLVYLYYEYCALPDATCDSTWFSIVHEGAASTTEDQPQYAGSAFISGDAYRSLIWAMGDRTGEGFIDPSTGDYEFNLGFPPPAGESLFVNYEVCRVTDPSSPCPGTWYWHEEYISANGDSFSGTAVQPSNAYGDIYAYHHTAGCLDPGEDYDLCAASIDSTSGDWEVLCDCTPDFSLRIRYQWCYEESPLPACDTEWLHVTAERYEPAPAVGPEIGTVEGAARGKDFANIRWWYPSQARPGETLGGTGTIDANGDFVFSDIEINDFAHGGGDVYLDYYVCLNDPEVAMASKFVEYKRHVVDDNWENGDSTNFSGNLVDEVFGVILDVALDFTNFNWRYIIEDFGDSTATQYPGGAGVVDSDGNYSFEMASPPTLDPDQSMYILAEFEFEEFAFEGLWETETNEFATYGNGWMTHFEGWASILADFYHPIRWTYLCGTYETGDLSMNNYGFFEFDTLLIPPDGCTIRIDYHYNRKICDTTSNPYHHWTWVEDEVFATGDGGTAYYWPVDFDQQGVVYKHGIWRATDIFGNNLRGQISGDMNSEFIREIDTIYPVANGSPLYISYYVCDYCAPEDLVWRRNDVGFSIHSLYGEHIGAGDGGSHYSGQLAMDYATQNAHYYVLDSGNNLQEDGSCSVDYFGVYSFDTSTNYDSSYNLFVDYQYCDPYQEYEE